MPITLAQCIMRVIIEILIQPRLRKDLIKLTSGKQANELQSSHIMFGSNNDNYATSMSNAFVNKHGQYQRSGPPINLMQTNYVPGDDPIPTESMYKHYHKQFPIETAKLNDELRTDLRGNDILI